ncbi:MAG TPA: hypothetical protein PKK40_06120 [Marmoricola sp.]|nr:hypothetical protein [Marmoricola sp.]
MLGLGPRELVVLILTTLLVVIVPVTCAVLLLRALPKQPTRWRIVYAVLAVVLLWPLVASLVSLR